MQLVEALLVFGELAPGGIKFHQQAPNKSKTKTKPPAPRPSEPLTHPDTLGKTYEELRVLAMAATPPVSSPVAEHSAFHAFCRFLHPASAVASLNRGEVIVLGAPVQVKPVRQPRALPNGELTSKTIQDGGHSCS